MIGRKVPPIAISAVMRREVGMSVPFQTFE